MDTRELTRSYEAWLRGHVDLVEDDLARKHEKLTDGAYPFQRGTFYLFLRRFSEVCPALARTPAVLGVGDLHVENFGTWRDAEGRLVWGVNDLDEAHAYPYALDLVRLGASALLAREAGHHSLSDKDACRAILAGYREGLGDDGGRPWVLEERHGWLRELAVAAEKDGAAFWQKLRGLPEADAIPAEAEEAIRSLLPERDLPFTVHRRQAGVGSLGLPRFVALVEDLRGGPIAREVKARAPSAQVWVDGGPAVDRYAELLSRAKRSPDPLVGVARGWLVRRLAPDCVKIELANLEERRADERLLEAMGRETANVHLGSAAALGAVREDLDARGGGWLAEAAGAMAEAVIADQEAWRGGMRSRAALSSSGRMSGVARVSRASS